MITAQVESFIECEHELRELIHAHWEELALNKDKVPLDPNWGFYHARELTGEMAFVTLRSRGVMIGYFIVFVMPGLHYQTCLTGTMDIFFIHPSNRGGTSALKLMRCVMGEMKRRGVQRVFFGTKLHKDIGRLFTSFGLEPVETYYSAWLGD